MLDRSIPNEDAMELNVPPAMDDCSISGAKRILDVYVLGTLMINSDDRTKTIGSMMRNSLLC